MTPMKLEFNNERLITGVNKLAKAVSSTLGPKGRYVAIQNPHKKLHVTKDGVTVASSIYLEDQVENMGAQLIKQAADKTVSEVGDGTTTATILTQAIIQESLKEISNGTPAIDIKRQLEAASTLAIKYLKEHSTPIKKDDIHKIAHISSNSDDKIASLVSQAYSIADEDGVISVSESKTSSHEVEKISGFQVPKGFISPHFINKTKQGVVEYEDPLIFIYDRELRTSDESVHLLNIAAEHKRPLLIIADDIVGPALNVLVLNKINAGLPVVAIKAPAYGVRRKEMLQDMAIATGANLISEDFGFTISQTTLEDLGTASKILITRSSTTIFEGNSNPEFLEERLNEIKADIEASPNSFVRKANEERLARLLGKIAVIKVGGDTDVEVAEIKDRLDDALSAVKAAIKDGVVPGGASQYFHYSERLSNQDNLLPGEKVLQKALLTPFKQIVNNAGQNPETISLLINSVTSEKENPESIKYGYNAATDKVVDLISVDIIDPVAVLTSALKNAVSIASVILMTTCSIYPEDRDLSTSANPHQPQ